MLIKLTGKRTPLRREYVIGHLQLWRAADVEAPGIFVDPAERHVGLKVLYKLRKVSDLVKTVPGRKGQVHGRRSWLIDSDFDAKDMRGRLGHGHGIMNG